jgi:hypothetical protein
MPNRGSSRLFIELILVRHYKELGLWGERCKPLTHISVSFVCIVCCMTCKGEMSGALIRFNLIILLFVNLGQNRGKEVHSVAERNRRLSRIESPILY